MPGVCAAGSQSLVPGPGVRQETPQSGEDGDSVGHPTGRGWFAGEPRGWGTTVAMDRPGRVQGRQDCELDSGRSRQVVLLFCC